MREVEIKAHASRHDDVKAYFDSCLGDGREVHKSDYYFRRPGESIQALRMRCYNGIVEFTTKKTHSGPQGEDNAEYEFRAMHDQSEAALSFFHALGYEDFFIKKKDGWEWFDDGCHIELLNVNSLGWFLEIESLLPFDASDLDAQKARAKIDDLMAKAGIDRADYESRSYREMILESEGGIQSKSHSC